MNIIIANVFAMQSDFVFPALLTTCLNVLSVIFVIPICHRSLAEQSQNVSTTSLHEVATNPSSSVGLCVLSGICKPQSLRGFAEYGFLR
jgi:hypothetical protein